MVAGLGDVNGDAVGREASKAVVVAYDALTLAGTQGYFNHLKLDRMLELAEVQQLPASASASASAPASASTYPTITTYPPTHVSTHPPTYPRRGSCPLCFAARVVAAGQATPTPIS